MKINDVFSGKQNLSESPESITGLQMMTNTLVKALAAHIAFHLNKKITDYPSAVDDLDVWDCAAITIDTAYPNRKGIKALPQELRTFPLAMKTLRISLAPGNGRTRGHYQAGGGWRQSEIVLRIEDDVFAKVREAAKQGNITFWTIMEMLKNSVSTLLHELVHAYDDFKSKGKYVDQDKYVSVDRPNVDQETFNKYLNNPAEINARYAQAIANVYGFQHRPWKEFFARFRSEFVGWRILSPEDKRRLTVRAATQFGRGQAAKSWDVTKPLADLSAKLAERLGTFVLLSYRNSGDAIVVHMHADIDNAKRAAIIHAACRAGEIYRKIVCVDSPLKPAEMKAMGFVLNRGRNKDYRLSTVWYRPVTREEAAGLRMAA
jgi:hypothetical protein